MQTDLVHVKYGFHLYLGLKRDLFLVHFQTKILQVFVISMHAIYHVLLILFDLVIVSQLLNLKLATAANLN
jgi:hypothetical protein